MMNRKILHDQSFSKRLLIVDDTPADIIGTYHLSFNLGYETTICFNGEDGLKELRKGEFDLIVLDLSMPVLNGVDFLKRIGSEQNLKKRQYNVIIHSSFPDLSWDLYLPKNVELKDLWQKPLSTIQILKRLKEIQL